MKTKVNTGEQIITMFKTLSQKAETTLHTLTDKVTTFRWAFSSFWLIDGFLLQAHTNVDESSLSLPAGYHYS